MKSLISLSFALFVCFSNGALAATTGNNAPDFSLPSLQGTSKKEGVMMRDFRGKVVYVDFWASWCGPCRKSMPVLEKIRTKYKDQGFEVVAINVDEKTDDAVRFLKKYPVSYPILLDPKGKTPAAYKVEGMPTAYIVDKAGVIRHVHTGFQDHHVEEIEKTITKLLAK